ncbi:hypothetical protein EKO27_g2917 [Xylaria grammica]|uniref:C2H2-type domain-containing protein n=1 Tax=Xylaria grammica TaxID=363999 RepID=A0A439DCT6_9PEZI|nr:hypothetical protein EKO27_g2917 [Xylaria grammica]
MFTAIPSLLRDYKKHSEWEIPIHTPDPRRFLALDTHFNGMTTLNDVDPMSHRYDCVAISGLASHPFASWQPKASDKTFMWIRDALPKHIHGVRAVIYGYETKLVESQTFERIKDIASKLITFLTTYGWGSRSLKPIVFLAHSLGGLVLRDALRQLSDGSSEEYRTLLNTLRGALFFGVPHLGMEQESFLAIVQGNPNDVLIDDIGIQSEYLRRLNKNFSYDPENSFFKFFWAYETLQSPTALRTPSGRVDRNGPLAILATHSDMVKFTRGSLDYHIVISKISSIVNNEKNDASLHYGHPNQVTEPETDLRASSEVVEGVTAEIGVFRRLSCISEAEEAKFLSATFSMIEATASEIQTNQESTSGLMYMRRLEPFMISMKQFAEVSEASRVSFGFPNPMAYIWGPMEYILRGDIAAVDTKSVSYKELEEIQHVRASSLQTFKVNKAAQDISRRATIIQWLSPYNCEADQAQHRKTRSICESPGAWLLSDSRFQKWSIANFCPDPFLWLNGIPGAGKTILASIIIDQLQSIPDAAVAYFYCKHSNESRDSFISVARAILAQLFRQRPHLTSYFFEKASTNGHALLDSPTTAREMIQTVFSSCNKTYIIIDGVDECGRIHRDEIAEVFRTAIEDLPTEQIGSVRCLFISQDDDNARRNFRNIPTINIGNESQNDIRDFSEKRHLALEAKFGPLRSSDCHISNILTARARGMFIFADLLAKYLEAQLNRAALLRELDPSRLPVDLDHVYQRILVRVFETRDDSTVASVRQILGWITCARRPLKWAEIQGAVCVDLDNQAVDHDKMLSDSPKGLFASLIEIKKDDTVELVHETARDYLVKHVINFKETNYSLAILSIGYLTLPQMDINEQKVKEDVCDNLVSGIYSFYDYASACWAMHLQEGISGLEVGTALAHLLETLETFIELHWSSTHKPLLDLKRVQNSLDLIKTSEYFEKVVQAVGWAKKQSSKYGQGPSQDEALDLWRVTKSIRSVLEDVPGSRPLESEEQREKLEKFYGVHWFKCPRVNCLRYYQGFATLEERQHHLNKHDKPYLCYVSGCHMEVFGYATSSELKRHLSRYHGIDRSDDTSDDEFPDPPKPKVANNAKSEGTYQCTECGKKFTRNHNLQNHMRSHQGSKQFECKECGETFGRKDSCDRHEREKHGEKKFICVGPLKNGDTWGCKKAFGRPDKLAGHFRTRTGRRCIKPHLEERMRENGGGGAENDKTLFDEQTGENADALRAAGKSLPPFQEFLQLCGLVSFAANTEAEASSSGKNPHSRARLDWR